MKNNTITTIILVILIMTSAFSFLLPYAKATDVRIISVTPVVKHAKVGESVHMIGTINKTNGLYRVFFGNNIVKEANATGNSVDVTFPVPKLPGANYTLTLQDVAMNINATSWFMIDPTYSISVNKAKLPTPPEQLQENGTIEIWVNITGGNPNIVYAANITVSVPSPGNETYWTLVKLTNTTNTGKAYNITTVYPTNFQSVANTNYTGAYTVYFNKTLAASTFTVGLTNSTEYHRFQSVNIKAIGYKPGENVTITVTYDKKIINPKLNLTAIEGGVINADWIVPSNASIGIYTVNVTSLAPLSTRTKKSPPDIQNFNVPGFPINVTAVNLADKPVPKVLVKMFEAGRSISNTTSGTNGLVTVKLEIGNYTCDAYFKNQKVGALKLNINETSSWDFPCNLTSIGITVANEAGDRIPEVKLFLAPENQTLTTDISGVALALSLLPNNDYTFNVSRYNKQFNTTKIVQLPIVAWVNVTVVVPTVKLEVNVTDFNHQPINNALVRAQEIIGGLQYEQNTTDGIATINCTFGKYTIDVFVNEARINETNVDMFQNRNMSIWCKLFGLNIAVQVVDYFGQPISRANVTLQREGMSLRSELTQADGKATFNNIIGGDLQMAVYLTNPTQPCVTGEITVVEPMTVEIKIGKYAMLVGFLIETSLLATIIIIVATVILIILIEIYRRKRLRPQQVKVEPK